MARKHMGLPSVPTREDRIESLLLQGAEPLPAELLEHLPPEPEHSSRAIRLRNRPKSLHLGERRNTFRL